MKPTLRAEKPQQEDWESRFDKKFFVEIEEVPNLDFFIKTPNTNYVKNFIRDLLYEERQRLIEEVREMVKNYFATKGFSSTNPDTAINLKYVQNTIKIELLNKLKRINEKHT